MASVSIKRLHNHWLANDIRKWSGRESSMWRPRSSFAIRMTSAQFIQCSNLLIRWPCSFDHLIYYHEFISLISFSKNRTLDFLKNQTMRIYFGYRLSLPLSLSLFDESGILQLILGEWGERLKQSKGCWIVWTWCTWIIELRFQVEWRPTSISRWIDHCLCVCPVG